MDLGAPRRRLPVEDVRCPDVKGLPDDVYNRLHHSFVDILKMRRGIESADVHIYTSREAILKSREALKRVRDDGF